MVSGSKVYLVGTKLCSLKICCVDGLASHSFSFAGFTSKKSSKTVCSSILLKILFEESHQFENSDFTLSYPLVLNHQRHCN